MTPWNFNEEIPWKDEGGSLARAANAAPMGVAELLREIKGSFQSRFSRVLLEGEIAQISRSQSGHLYVLLKDRREEASISCVLFRQSIARLQFSPKQGDVVQISGSMSVFAQRGQMNLIVDSMSLAGQGDLYAEFLRLKERLQSEGLFDAAAKRPIPKYPSRIGVITSPEAAALQDVVRTIRSAAPFMPITRYSASVQGEMALSELIAAIERANREKRVDVILLVRGGGSIGDLWTYNLEPLARAIRASEIPIVTGVGHESDLTIADLVADVRAATPTAAAGLVTQYWAAAPDLIAKCEERLSNAMRNQLGNSAMRLDAADRLHLIFSRRLAAYSARLAQCGNMPREFAHYVQLLGAELQRQTSALERNALDLVAARSVRLERLCSEMAANAPQLPVLQERLAGLKERLGREAELSVRERAQQLDALGKRLQGVSVEGTLARGYAIAQDETGAVMRDAARYSPNAVMTVRLARGSVRGRVTEVLKESADQLE